MNITTILHVVCTGSSRSCDVLDSVFGIDRSLAVAKLGHDQSSWAGILVVGELW